MRGQVDELSEPDAGVEGFDAAGAESAEEDDAEPDSLRRDPDADDFL